MQVTNTTVNYGILTFAVLVMATAFAMAPGLTSANLVAEHIGYMLRVTARNRASGVWPAAGSLYCQAAH